MRRRSFAWHDQALCRTHPDRDWWTSPLHLERQKAARLCDGCPVIDICAVAGRQEHYGVWGGIDREQITRRLRRIREHAGGPR